MKIETKESTFTKENFSVDLSHFLAERGTLSSSPLSSAVSFR